MSRDNHEALAECYRIIEETGSIEQALLLHPELEGELRANSALWRRLTENSAQEPDPGEKAAGERLLLAALAARQASRSGRLPGKFVFKLAGGLAGFVLMGGAALGAAAAGDNVPGPMNDVLNKVGLHSQQAADDHDTGRRGGIRRIAT